MTQRIADNEPLKAACHGLLLGCLLPVIAYNISERKWGNVVTYTSLLLFELVLINEHMQETKVPNGP